jgi:hypothetical protein
MRDYFFDKLIADYGEPTDRRTATPEVIERYRSVLPDQLLGYWQTEGFCQFRHGLMFIVNPDDWQPTVDKWLHGTPYEKFGKFYAIQRSAFGVVSLFNRTIGASVIVCPLRHEVVSGTTKPRVSDDSLALSVAMTLTTPSRLMEAYDVQDEPLFERALTKLGPVGWDEMFAFDLARCLGGPATLSNLTKLDWRVHLSLLHQLQPPHVPYTDINVPEESLKP